MSAVGATAAVNNPDTLFVIYLVCGGCSAAGALAISTTYFQLASILWTTSIAFTLYRCVFQPDGVHVPRKEKTWHLVCWLLPSLSILCLVETKSLGYDHFTGLCYLSTAQSDEPWLAIAVFYLPVLLCVAYNTVVYYRVNRAMRVLSQLDQGTSGACCRRGTPLWLYPLVVLFSWLPGLTLRVLDLVNRSSSADSSGPLVDLTALQPVAVGCQFTQGLLHATVYMFSLDVFAQLCKRCLRCVRGRGYMDEQGLRELTEEAAGEQEESVVSHLVTRKNTGASAGTRSTVSGSTNRSDLRSPLMSDQAHSHSIQGGEFVGSLPSGRASSNHPLSQASLINTRISLRGRSHSGRGDLFASSVLAGNGKAVPFGLLALDKTQTFYEEYGSDDNTSEGSSIGARSWKQPAPFIE